MHTQTMTFEHAMTINENSEPDVMAAALAVIQDHVRTGTFLVYETDKGDYTDAEWIVGPFVDAAERQDFIQRVGMHDAFYGPIELGLTSPDAFPALLDAHIEKWEDEQDD